MILEKGRPENAAGRSQEEIHVYDVLDQLEIAYGRTDHEPADTMELCRVIDDILSPAVICKNIFLCNTQKTKFYLLLLREDKKFVTKEISKQLGSSRLSFAPEEYLLKYLHTPSGSASIFGLLYDSEHEVQLAVDEDVFRAEWFGAHPCRNTSSLKLKTEDVFEVFLPYTGHGFVTVKAE